MSLRMDAQITTDPIETVWESQSEMGVTGAGRLKERRPPEQGCLGRHPAPARPTSEAGTDAKQQGGLPGAGDWSGGGLSWKEGRCWVGGDGPAARARAPPALCCPLAELPAFDSPCEAG